MNFDPTQDVTGSYNYGQQVGGRSHLAGWYFGIWAARKAYDLYCHKQGRPGISDRKWYPALSYCINTPIRLVFWALLIVGVHAAFGAPGLVTGMIVAGLVELFMLHVYRGRAHAVQANWAYWQQREYQQQRQAYQQQQTQAMPPQGKKWGWG